jgi:energy-coupling factor transport system permease protein
VSEKLLVKQPIYPLFGLVASVLIIVFGLITAKETACIWFLGGMWLLFLAFGYWRSCLAVIPVAAVLSMILAGFTYAISKDPRSTYAAVNRILAVCIAVIPGLALSPIYLVRNFSTLKLPRMLTLGMMITLTFFPLLNGEVRQVREAMKTRGAGSFFSPKIFYRAFLIPLIMRLVNISDTLALSVETRGFTKEATVYSVYKTIKLRHADILFLLLVAAGSILVVAL